MKNDGILAAPSKEDPNVDPAAKSAIGSPSFESLRDELRLVMVRFFDIMYPAGLVLGGIALAASIYRSMQNGWYLMTIMHSAMFIVAMVVLAFRKHLSVFFMFSVMIGLISLDVVHSLFNMGLASSGMMGLTVLSTFIGVFFGIRAGMISVGAGVLTASVIGAGISTGMITIRPDVSGRLAEPITWIAQIACFAMYVIPLIITINHVRQRMVKSLSELRKKNDQLQREISMRRSVEDQFGESDAKYRSVVENSVVAFYIVQDSLFRFVNDRFCELTGYSQVEVIDKLGPLDTVHPDEREKVRDNLKRRLEGQNAEREYALKLVTKDRRVLTVKILGNGITYKGRPAASGTIIDITKETALESQLRQSQKMEAIGTLAGGIAHDFNNILTALTGYGSILQKKMDADSPLRHYADHILSASQKAASLTQSLLAFGRLQPIDLRALDLNSLVRGTEKLLSRLITEDIALVTDLAFEDIVVMADSTQIDQILFNLVTNARDAMPAGGTLKISTRIALLNAEFKLVHGFGEPGQYALLSVSDTGTGMDKTTKEKIFDPFFTTKEVGRGTGLGLSNVYGIVKQHNGYITVQSEPGQGTLFHIYIPVVRTVVEEVKPLVQPVRRGDETILVAEDSEAVRIFVREILGDHGYRVIEAKDGSDAVSKFEQHEEISLVILDSVMPRKNGKEAYDAIQEIKPGTKTLFMSGYTPDVILNKGISQHEFDFIAKPLSPHLFLTKVGEILDRPITGNS
jgi:PAS domain S-box-containing protein